MCETLYQVSVALSAFFLVEAKMRGQRWVERIFGTMTTACLFIVSGLMKTHTFLSRAAPSGCCRMQRKRDEDLEMNWSQASDLALHPSGLIHVLDCCFHTLSAGQ